MSDSLTKEERRAIKAQAKLAKQMAKMDPNVLNSTERWVVCLKYGEKYHADYVNKLYNMVKRNTTGNVGFACMTENPKGLNPDITIIPLPLDVGLQGWWYKPYIFHPNFPLTGSLLFMDLDIVIVNNIDHFWMHSPSRFCIIRDFTRAMAPSWQKFNSSIFRLQSRTMPFVWENLVNNIGITKRLHGDQDWLFNEITEGFDFWPDEWCQSYKWEIRDRSEIVGTGRDRKFNQIKDTTVNPNTSILVFHGDPKPEQVQDPIIVENWC